MIDGIKNKKGQTKPGLIWFEKILNPKAEYMCLNGKKNGSIYF